MHAQRPTAAAWAVTILRLRPSEKTAVHFSHCRQKAGWAKREACLQPHGWLHAVTARALPSRKNTLVSHLRAKDPWADPYTILVGGFLRARFGVGSEGVRVSEEVRLSHRPYIPLVETDKPR